MDLIIGPVSEISVMSQYSDTGNVREGLQQVLSMTSGHCKGGCNKTKLISTGSLLHQLSLGLGLER